MKCQLEYNVCASLGHYRFWKYIYQRMVKTKHIRTIIDGHWDGFHYGFLPIKKLFLRNKNLNKFCRDVCSKATPLFKPNTSFFSCFIFLIGIHSMQGLAATTRYGVTRKRSTKGLNHAGNFFTKNLQLIGVC